MTEITYDWKRFWCARDGTISLLDRGYLFDPESKWGSVYNPEVKIFSEIADTQCLILLGEPGMGKSNAVDLEHRALLLASRLALKFDLITYQTDARLVEEIFRCDAFLEWIASDSELHLFLDGFDESPIRRDSLSATLATELSKLPISRLFLRIACRTADWPSYFEEKLKALWAPEKVSAYEIAPLRRKDVVEAAQRRSIPETAFLDEINQRSVVPLAIKPITLKFLLNTYIQQKSLPTSQADLYDKGCYILCEEQSPSRRAAGDVGSLSTDQRLAVAARIAAVTIFAVRYAVYVDVYQGEMQEEDIDIKSLTGGFETVDGTPFQITEAAIRETLATGLFSLRGQHRLGWAHQTYAEYLAARYLIDHGLSSAKILSLIAHATDPQGQLVPQLHQTAAWLASQSPDIFRMVTEVDPGVLLKSDISTVELKDRVKLVESLLQSYEQGKLHEEFDTPNYYKKLKHPQLTDQLRPYVQDKGKDSVLRRIAIDIAEKCQERDLLDALCLVALDSTEPLALRTNAVTAIRHIGDSEAISRLRPLLFNQTGPDPFYDLKGCALLALWPEHINATELFSILTPAASAHHSGPYDDFLTDKLTSHLNPRDFTIALTWVERQPPAHSEVIDAIVRAAAQHLDEPGVLSAFARAALMRLRFHDDIFVREETRHSEKHSELPVAPLNESHRRRLLTEIIPFIASAKDIPLGLTHSRHALVIGSDVPWLLEQLGQPSSEEAKTTIALLTLWVHDRTDPDQVEAIYFAQEKCPALAEQFAQLFRPIEIESPDAQHLKERHHRMRQWQQKRHSTPMVEPPPGERVKMQLTQFEAGNTDAWWWLYRELTLEPNSTNYGSDYISDLTSLPGWKAADPDTKSRIIVAAKTYVLLRDSEPSKWLGQKENYRPALAGYRALRLLAQKEPHFLDGLTTKDWSRWAPIVAAFPFQSQPADIKAQQTLVTMAYRHVPTTMIAMLLLSIDIDNNQHGFLNVLDTFEECWEPRLALELRYKVGDPRLKPASYEKLLRTLLARRVEGALEFALLSVSESSTYDENRPHRALEAAYAVVAHTEDAAWPVVWDAMLANSSFGEKLIARFAERDQDITKSITHKLSEPQLADLFVWLTQRFPHAEDPEVEGFHGVSERESIGQWRETILGSLHLRGTPQACIEIQKIMYQFPHLSYLNRVLAEAQSNMRRKTWIPLRPNDVLTLTTHGEARLVQSSEQLLDLVIDALERLQVELTQSETPAAIDLWSRISPNVYRPKDEEELSNYVKRHLNKDLKKSGVFGHREVEILRGTGGVPGELVDIHVNAIAFDSTRREYDRLAVIVEVKGSWNDSLDTDMETQLLNRYLKTSQRSAGLYLVGWFNCKQWDKQDARKKQADKNPDKGDLQRRLTAQAARLSTLDAEIKAYVLDASLR